MIAHDSGNRYTETLLIADLAASRSNTVTRWRRSITSLWRSEISMMRATSSVCVSPLADLAVLLDRLGRYEPAATIAGFVGPFMAQAFPLLNIAIARLRDVLGDKTYESLAHKGESMTASEIATYAYDQIDQARAELNAVSK